MSIVAICASQKWYFDMVKCASYQLANLKKCKIKTHGFLTYWYLLDIH